MCIIRTVSNYYFSIFRPLFDALSGACWLHGRLLYLRVLQHEGLDVPVARGRLQAPGAERQLAGAVPFPGRAGPRCRQAPEGSLPPQVPLDHHDGRLLRNLGLVRQDPGDLEDVLPATVRPAG